jgi:hypothetical protein
MRRFCDLEQKPTVSPLRIKINVCLPPMAATRVFGANVKPSLLSAFPKIRQSPVGEFHFVEDRVHHLKENPMGKSEICDPSSESISGYMDIKGSKYDENGEDKHLFFWMFEKRNADVEESAEEIPFVVWLTGKYVVVGVLTSRMPRCSFGGRNSYFSCDIHLACGVNILKTLIVCFAF